MQKLRAFLIGVKRDRKKQIGKEENIKSIFFIPKGIKFYNWILCAELELLKYLGFR